MMKVGDNLLQIWLGHRRPLRRSYVDPVLDVDVGHFIHPEMGIAAAWISGK